MTEEQLREKLIVALGMCSDSKCKAQCVQELNKAMKLIQSYTTHQLELAKQELLKRVKTEVISIKFDSRSKGFFDERAEKIYLDGWRELKTQQRTKLSQLKNSSKKEQL